MQESHFQPGDFEARHSKPAWRERADFIIAINVSETAGKREWEQLWARRLSDHRFEICCIPFFAYDVALGDEVETDARFLITGVVKPSGHSTFRVWLKEASPVFRGQVIQFLDRQKHVYEWHSDNLLSIDGESDDAAQSLSDFLLALEGEGKLTYETGRSK